EALMAIERVPRGRQDAYQSLRTSGDVIERNLDLIDLTYPHRKLHPIVNEIRAGFASTELFDIDVDGVMEELHNMQMVKAKLYAQYICESNEKFDAKHYREELVLWRP